MRSEIKRFTGRAARPLLTMGIGGGLVWLLASRLDHIDPAAVHALVFSLAPQQWALALAAVLLSFVAVGGQERVLHRHLGTGLPGGQVFAAGMAAGAVSQAAGFGPLTGALIRWRLLPGLTLWQSTRLSAAMTIGFLSALAILASTVLVTLHATPYEPLGWTVLAAAGGFALVSVLRPRWLPRPAAWPNALTIAAFLFWAALDLAALSLALWALFPAPDAPAFATLLPVVLLALGAGLASGAPAGVGAFEMVLMSLLADVDEAPLMAAVVAWRACFYALPALLGMGWAALAPRGAAPCADRPHPPQLSPRAECGLLHQGALALSRTGTQTCLTGTTPHLRVALFEPYPGKPDPDALTALARLARRENRLPALYKCDARLAATARKAGWRSLRIAAEAVLDPARFDISGSTHATLRRKLRKAEQAGITVTRGHDPHCPRLAAINAAWSRANGGERGFSMGRFCAAHIARQCLYVAWRSGEPVAFVTFHSAPQEWVLDLMRHGNTLPDGTMHALILAAINDANRNGVPRLSLAAVPDLPAPFARLAPAEAAGLRRFKQAFAPRWEPRFLCAPSLASLALAGAEITSAIRRPAPLVPQPVAERWTGAPHHQDADYEFATAPASWQRKA
jgi:phosphatidylglycerol lysyltransferase